MTTVAPPTAFDAETADNFEDVSPEDSEPHNLPQLTCRPD
jgi:hypothetical protein